MEDGWVVGIGQVVAMQAGEFPCAAFADGGGKVALVVGEEAEGGAGACLFAHEGQRDHGGGQEEGVGDAGLCRVCQRDQTVAEGAVADLVMVLVEGDEGGGGQVARGFAPRFRQRRAGLALFHEAFGQRQADVVQRVAGEAGVVIVGFAGQQGVDGVVPVVVPFGDAQAVGGVVVAGDVAVVLGHQVDGTVEAVVADGQRQFGDEVGVGRVVDPVDGIEAQAVEAVLGQPVEGVLDGEAAHGGLGVVDHLSPRGRLFGMEDRRDGGEVEAVGAEMVVHDVEDDHQPQRLRRFDKALQVVRRAIGEVDGIGQDAVIAPAVPPRELGDGHQFDGGETQFRKARQGAGGGGEGAFGREGADVDFLDHGFGPGAALPAGRPAMGGRIDQT